MMATTHALVGSLLAISTVFFAPEYTPVAVAAGVAGGVFPDLDLYGEHRKTLHFPVYYPVVALAGVVLALAVPTTVTVGVAFFLVAAALHSVLDAFGGGLELRPWRGVSERAVYDHYHGRWIRPRRWIRYDGAPEDFVFGALLAVPALVVYHGPTRNVIVGLVAISGIYALLRKPLVRVAEWVVARIPERFERHIPERFIADLR